MNRRADPTRRGLLCGAVATLALPALIRNAQAAAVTVAAVHASPVDNPWNARVHAAFREAVAAGAISYDFRDGVAANDYADALRSAAAGGARLVWGESFAVEAIAREVAAEYPDTSFLMGSSGQPQGRNFGVFGTRNHETAYLAGMLAGAMSATGVFGSVGGFALPEVNLVINAFRAGVLRTNADGRFLNTFIGAWFDPVGARDAAIAQIDQGADILFAERFGAADGAAARGVRAIGSLADFNDAYPGTVFASAVWNFGPTVDAIVTDLMAGAPIGRDYTEFSLMRHGGNALTLVESDVPPAALATMAEVRTAIRAGTFTVPIDTSEPD